jgi:hypothetical protein
LQLLFTNSGNGKNKGEWLVASGKWVHNLLIMLPVGKTPANLKSAI